MSKLNHIKTVTKALIFTLASTCLAASQPKQPPLAPAWKASQLKLLQVLALPSPGQKPAPEPAQATLGQRLFYDQNLNPEKKIACVSCHQPELAYSDGLRHPVGNPLQRNTPTLIGSAHNRWLYWDGRKDSLWSQALEPLFAAHEIGLKPDTLLHRLDQSTEYRLLFQQAFGAWPTPLPRSDSQHGQHLQAQIGLSIAAYIKTLDHQPAPFDRYVWALGRSENTDAEQWLSQDQVAGLKIMLRSNCLSCHQGARFTDGKFHNIGTGETDLGRANGVTQWRTDVFNCAGDIAASIDHDCADGRSIANEIPSLEKGAFKTPSLRELNLTAPYMHDGRFTTLAEVIEHYRNPPAGRHGLSRMNPLSDHEAAQLEQFLHALSSSD